jgi:hypothetical protein
MELTSNKWLAVLLLAAFVAACGESSAPAGGAGISGNASKKMSPPQPVISWNADTNDIKIESVASGAYISGNGSRFGYQASSPSIPVKKDTETTVRLDYKADSGRVCPGILSGNRQSWVHNNDNPVTEFTFNTGKNDSIYIVFSNCNKTESGNPASRFLVKSVSIAFAEK